MTVETWDPCRSASGHHHGRATPAGTDDEKDAMRWLASTAAEAVA